MLVAHSIILSVCTYGNGKYLSPQVGGKATKAHQSKWAVLLDKVVAWYPGVICIYIQLTMAL